MEYANYVTSRWPKLQYDMAVGLQTPFIEPDEWLRAQLRTGASRNWFSISDPELDAMLDEQRTSWTRRSGSTWSTRSRPMWPPS